MDQCADRVATLTGVLEHIGTLDATEQLTLLDAILRFDRSTSEAEKTGVFSGVLNKIGSFDKAIQPSAWEKMLQHFKILPGNAQTTAFDDLLKQIDTLDAMVKQGALNRLQSYIVPLLPESERLSASARIQKHQYQG
ncbi:hypothetical protein AWB78_08677 [Caballeronia calidae]|uniref:Uncharacterized protein n=2 Tax=Caballeronia calidae TaxID=1777139 RepID=A0A158EL98_9BURK|nr:hypothetical protein AWB78_08677 [Caballeronia calidae]